MTGYDNWLCGQVEGHYGFNREYDCLEDEENEEEEECGECKACLNRAKLANEEARAEEAYENSKLDSFHAHELINGGCCGL